MAITSTATSRAPVLPVMYKIKEKLIPAGLSLENRIIFVQGLGVPSPQATLLAMQDRSASLIAILAGLVQNTGDAQALNIANSAIEKWNADCNKVFGA